MAIFQKLHASGNTIIIVTHEPEIAEFTERIVRFRDGHLEGDEKVINPRKARAKVLEEGAVAE